MVPHSKAFTLTLVQEGGRECAELPLARVRLRGPLRDNMVADLGLGPVVVGSGSDCELVVEDPYVSRRHCQFTLSPRGVVVRDLGSRNGTWVQSMRVFEALLPPGAS